MNATARRWNSDKSHHCPNCHVIVDTGQPATLRAVYECCHCGIRFARWPRLAWFLPVRYCADIATGEGCSSFSGTGLIRM